MLAVLEVGVMSGRIAGRLAARRLSVTRPLFVVASVLAIMCVSSGLVSAFPTVVTARVSYTVMGICASVAAVAVTTGIQQLAQPAIRGRVLALQGAGMTAVPTLGVLLIAQLSDAAGPRVAFAVIAVMLAVLALLARVADQRVLLAS
jgi:MFS family permease